MSILDLERSTVFFRDKYVPFNEASLNVASAPVLYGLSIYTVFPVIWDDKKQSLFGFRLRDHFERLRNSAKIIGFEEFVRDWTYDRFLKMVQELIDHNDTTESVLVRVSVFADGILTGTRMRGIPQHVTAFIYPAVPLIPRTGARLCVSSWRRTPDNAIPSRAKINGSYVNASLMKQEALLNGFDDAIALDFEGHVTESSVANIFLVRLGKLITPASSADLLEGITRDSVMQIATSLNLVVEQRTIDRSELYIADEIFLCGSSMNITPVISVDHRLIDSGKPGRITKSLIKAYGMVGTNDMNEFRHWLTKIPINDAISR
jgi:branched-chain amino acid aminotransferase